MNIIRSDDDGGGMWLVLVQDYALNSSWKLRQEKTLPEENINT